jgi:Family of unknown function (DUF6228)
VDDDADTEPVEVVVGCMDDHTVRVRFFDPYFPYDCIAGFSVEFHAPGLHAHLDEVEIYTGDPLDAFLRQLAEDFRGWVGERTWSTNHLAVRAVWRSGGRVRLTWTLRPLLTPGAGWEASVVTWLEAGEQMAALAADVQAFLEPDGTGTSS